MCTQDLQDDLVAKLQELGVLHLEELNIDSDEDGELTVRGQSGSSQRSQVENLLIKARGILDLFEEVDPDLVEEIDKLEAVTGSEGQLSSEFQEELGSLEGRLKALVSERRELRDRLSAASYLSEIIDVSEGLLPQMQNVEGEVVAMIGEAKDPEPITTEIMVTLNAQMGGRVAIESKKISEDRFVLLVKADSDYVELIAQYLEEKGLRQITLPPHIDVGFGEGIAILRSEEQSIPARLSEIDSMLGELASEHAGRVFVLANALENRMARHEAGGRFGYTDYTTIITGWIPTEEYQAFSLSLVKDFPGVIVQEDLLPVNEHDTPVALRQGKWARPYKVFLDMFGTPQYGTMDPTFVISLFFPIFFGIIVGDVGYGLIVLAAVLWGYAGFPGIKSGKKLVKNAGVQGALRIVRDGAISSIIFGLLFGEIFGLEMGNAEKGGPFANIPPEIIPIANIPYIGEIVWPFSRIHNEITLLNFTVLIGVLMVSLGFLHGVVLSIRHKNYKELMAKLGLFAAMVGMGLAIASLMGIVSGSVLYVGLGIFAVVGIPLCVIGGGFVVAMESISPFVHVLSFARLMGFALAGAVLAGLINDLMLTIQGATASVIVGGIRLILAALVGVLLHALNLVLHVFEGSIQSARLHWVEYFGKFMLESLGGKPYEPFREKKISEQ